MLEEYSHCEVPAGCGGVVLRWRDPEAGIPLRVSIASFGEAALFVDGEAVSGSDLALRPAATRC